MQEDKNLKEMLLKWGVEETSPGFTATVMNSIEAASATKQYKQPLLNNKLKQIFVLAFLFLSLALFAISIYMKPADLPFVLSIPKIKFEYFTNTLTFLLIFWIFMISNHWLNNKIFKNLG